MPLIASSLRRPLHDSERAAFRPIHGFGIDVGSDVDMKDACPPLPGPVRTMIAVIAVCFLSLSAASAALGQPKVGDLAPLFQLPKLKGGELNLASFRGKTNVVLVFFRGWVGYW